MNGEVDISQVVWGLKLWHKIMAPTRRRGKWFVIFLIEKHYLQDGDGVLHMTILPDEKGHGEKGNEARKAKQKKEEGLKVKPDEVILPCWWPLPLDINLEKLADFIQEIHPLLNRFWAGFKITEKYFEMSPDANEAFREIDRRFAQFIVEEEK